MNRKPRVGDTTDHKAAISSEATLRTASHCRVLKGDADRIRNNSATNSPQKARDNQAIGPKPPRLFRMSVSCSVRDKIMQFSGDSHADTSLTRITAGYQLNLNHTIAVRLFFVPTQLNGRLFLAKTDVQKLNQKRERNREIKISLGYSTHFLIENNNF